MYFFSPRDSLAPGDYTVSFWPLYISSFVSHHLPTNYKVATTAVYSSFPNGNLFSDLCAVVLLCSLLRFFPLFTASQFWLHQAPISSCVFNLSLSTGFPSLRQHRSILRCFTHFKTKQNPSSSYYCSCPFTFHSAFQPPSSSH